MAESAALLLKVGLDLNHFRKELSRASSELAGQPITVGIKIDRSKIVSEFQLLNRYLGNKTFRATIETNLSAEIDKARKLAEALKNIPTGGGASGAVGTIEKGFTQKAYKAISPENIKKLYRAAADAGLLAFNETIAKRKEDIVRELANVGQSSIAGLLNGLTSGDAKIRAAAESLGKILIATIKSELGIASPSKETGKLGKFAAEGFENGFVAGMVRAERNMARAIRSAVIGAIKDGLGNLPGMGGALVSFERQLAASVQLAVRKAMREGMKSSVLPGAKGTLLGGAGGAATGAVVGGAKALGGGVAGGVAKLTAGGVLGTAANLARYSIDNSAYQEFVGKLYQEIINSALSSGTQGAIIGALAVGGVAGGIGFARGATGSLALQAITAIRNRILAALIAVSTGELNNVVKVMVRDITKALFEGSIKQLRAATAQLPTVNWPATTPKNGAGRVSTASTMALPAGKPFAALPGSAFGAQRRLIGDILEPSLKEILRGAANAFVDAVRQGMNDAIRSVSVRDLGKVPGKMLPGGRVAGLLSAGVGRMPSPYAMGGAGGGLESQAELFARREREARQRSALRAIDVMGGGGGRQAAPYNYAYRPVSRAIVPYARGGALVPMGGGGIGGGGGGAGGGGGGGFSAFGPNFGRDLQKGLAGKGGKGLIREMAEDFGFAAKQVLLFGTTYKALAAITSLPSNIAAAASNLQSFRNQLEAVTGGGKIMSNSLQLIEDTVKKFNMPLDSARQGFVRLYASMAPAGISVSTINDIFTGLAATSTTLGMSSDQVDRMTYALSQMASKGQITSEELKGQLGDVFPQAVSLFAKAAGFLNDTMSEQAKAKGISAFLKALEDGAFRGEAMQKVLQNVGVLLNQDFGPTGEKAASSFRGQMTALSNALTSFYESFSPIASAFVGEFVAPIVASLTAVGNAVKLALSEDAIKGNPLASYFRDELFPQLQNIKTALLAAGQTFGIFAQAIAVALKPLAQLILGNQELVSGIARGLVILAIYRTGLGALNAMGIIPLIQNIIKYNTVFRVFIAQTAAGANGVRAFSAATAATGMSAAQAVTGIRTLATTIRTALVASAIGVAVVAIGLLIEKIMQLQAVADNIGARGRGVSARLTTAARGGKESLGGEVASIKAEIQSANRMRELYVKGTKQSLTDKELQFIQDRGGDISMFSGLGGGARAITMAEKRQAMTAADVQQRTLLTMQGRLQETLPTAQKNAAVIDRRLANQSTLNMTGLGTALAGDGGGKKKAKGGGSDKEAAQLAEEIKRQAMAASDALFAEQQRLVILQQTNPIAKAFAEYASKDLTIQRELNKALAEAKSEKEKEDIKETTRLQQSANALELEQAMKSVREDAVRSVEDLLKGQREQLQYEEDVKQLLTEGMLPERAKQVAEVRKLIRAQLDTLDLSIQQAEAALNERESREGSTDAVKKLREELEKLKKARGDVEGKGKQAEAGVPTPTETTKSPMDYIKDGASAAQEELNKLTNWGYQAVQGANAVGSAFGKAFADIASGAQSADQALATAFQSIASHFFDMAAQIITQMITMYILKTLIGIFAGSASGGGGGGSSGFDMGSLGNISSYGGSGPFQFADGGFVNGPTSALIGEGGEPEYVIPSSKMQSAMARYGAGARGASVIPGNGDVMSQANSVSMGEPVTIDMRYSVERINSVDYVTADQFQLGMARAAQQGAQQGEQRTLRRLQMSTSTRRRVGL